jgi:hypothetical protein
MNLKEYKQQILATYIDDWTSIACWGANSGPSYRNSVIESSIGGVSSLNIDSHSTVLSLKSNLNIQISHGLTANERYHAEWTKNFSDDKAESCFIDFFYNNQLVFRDTYILIDGARCLVPSPRFSSENKEYYIPEEKNDFYHGILNSHVSDYDYYVSETGFKIIDLPWME